MYIYLFVYKLPLQRFSKEMLIFVTVTMYFMWVKIINFKGNDK